MSAPLVPRRHFCTGPLSRKKNVRSCAATRNSHLGRVFARRRARAHRLRGQHRPAVGRRLRQGALVLRGHEGGSPPPCSRPTARACSPPPGTIPPGCGTPPPARSSVLRGHEAWVRSAVFSPTARACSPPPGTTPPGCGTPRRPGAGGHARPRGQGHSAVFSPDGARVLTASGTTPPGCGTPPRAASWWSFAAMRVGFLGRVFARRRTRAHRVQRQDRPALGRRLGEELPSCADTRTGHFGPVLARRRARAHQVRR